MKLSNILQFTFATISVTEAYNIVNYQHANSVQLKEAVAKQLEASEIKQLEAGFDYVDYDKVFRENSNYGMTKYDGYAKITTHKNAKRAAAYVHQKFLKRDDSGTEEEKEAAEFYSFDIPYNDILFAFPIEIGSKNDFLSVQLDTGSSDLWVTTKSWDSTCQYADFKCSTKGHFKPKDSKTFKSLNNPFNVSYLGGYSVTGYYGEDTVALGDDIVLDDFQFAVAEDADITMAGMLGIGLKETEVQFLNNGTTYDNFMFALAKKGYINSPSYSMALGRNNEDGVFLLGAIDHSKYIGEIYKFPMVEVLPGNGVQYVALTLNGISAGGFKKSQNGSDYLWRSDLASGSTAAILDSGATSVILPSSIISQIRYAFDFETDYYSGMYYKNCSDINFHDFVSFDFQGFTVDIPLYYLVQKTQQYCVLYAYSSNIIVLGDVFLKAAYFVADYENSEIGIANGNLVAEDGTDENEIEVINGTMNIPTNSFYSSTYSAPSSTLYTNGLSAIYADTTVTYFSPTDVPLYYNLRDQIVTNANATNTLASDHSEGLEFFEVSTSTSSNSRTSTRTTSSTRNAGGNLSVFSASAVASSFLILLFDIFII
ncbi:hypothetical protein B5S33_g744 [[Candida] boidinii]|nr:hypothetical protein B5S33_g744 [[Candida] boidinii]